MAQKISLDNFKAGQAGAQINVGLLGFKMAVNDSLTIFNLVDGVVDEFHEMKVKVLTIYTVHQMIIILIN